MATSVEVSLNDELRLRKLAREIAMDIIERDDVLAAHGVSEREWNRLTRNSRFAAMLREEMEIWQSTHNTRERVDIKTVFALELAVEQMHLLIHNRQEPANARVEAFKALQRGAGIGARDGVVDTGNKIQIVINTGNKEMLVEREVTPKVIEGSAVEL